MLLSEFSPIYLVLDRSDEITVARFTLQRLTEEENMEVLGHEMFALVEQYGCRKLALDFTGVEGVTSAVLGKLITLHRKMHRHQGKLVLCHISEPIQGVMRISRLLDYFHTRDDLAAAKQELETIEV